MTQLNADQQAVLNESQGARVCLAGPGSGKSTTMVALIRSLIESGVRPSDIRAVTFSREMALVLEKKLQIKGIASTFHSLGYAICSQVDRKPVEPELRFRLMCKLVKKWGVEYGELDQFISKMRRESVSPQDAIDHVDPYSLAHAYAEYEQVRKQEGWMDFDSMLADSVQLLEVAQNRAKWQSRYLIVDEAQDTDDLQWRMMQLLSEQHGNITVVGDPGQAIYAFRGAKPENITDFQRWFPQGRYYYLGRNYRCHPAGVEIRCASGQGKNQQYRQFTTLIEKLNDEKAVSWNQRSWHFALRGQSTKRTTYSYDGPMFTISTATHGVPVTINHHMLVKWNPTILNKHAVYLMWRGDKGFRIGQCALASPSTNGRRTIRLWHRIHKQRPDKIWILKISENQRQARVDEAVLSARFGIPQTEYISDNRESKWTRTDIQAIFSQIPRQNGFKCLDAHHLLFDEPLVSSHSRVAKGYFLTAACNVIPRLMSVPTEDAPWGEMVTSNTQTWYTGEVHSLEVAKDHTYIANGIVVGNSTPEIVNFVRENTPPDIPSELVTRMLPARTEQGAPIGMRMYWLEEDEAEAALVRATRDPLHSIILARTNHWVGLLQRVCGRHHVRYHLLGKTSFWKQNEVRRAIEGLKVYPTLALESAFGMVLPSMMQKYAVDDRTERDNDALENLKSLRDYGKDFQTTKEFVAYANKMMHRRNDPYGVTLSTVHQAKGGEWKNVFLVGASAKGFPHPKGEPKEERRIYYVAISRAIDNLRISFSGTPSPYLRRYLSEAILDKLREKATEVERLQEQQKLFA